MRLTCPNCGAQYEVDPSVVPETGRDVQCSSCGKSWFQEALTAETSQTDMSQSVAQAPAAEAAETVDHAAEPTETTQNDENNSEDTPPNQPLKRTALSDSVRDILRAEVEFDSATRPPLAQSSLETQPDLGLDNAPAESASLNTPDAINDPHVSDISDMDASEISFEEPPLDALPDIEEINSTLSASSERDNDGTVPDLKTRKTRAERSKLKTTFMFLTAVCVLLILLYILAPVIHAKVPASREYLEVYLAHANEFRDWIDQIVATGTERLNDMLQQFNGS